MRVDTVRRIDYWVGIPLCAGLSLIAVFLKVFLPVRKKTQPKKALFIELSEMGSAILVDPAMRWLRSETGAELYFLIFKKNKPSLQLLKTVPDTNIFTIRDEGLFSLAFDTLKFLIQARRSGIDTVIDLELFSRFTALLTGLSGARNRVGYYAFHHEGLYRGSLLTHRVAYNPHIHISKNFMSIVHAAASTQEQLPYSKVLVRDEDVKLTQLSFAEDEKTRLRQEVKKVHPSFDPKTQRVVLINPNASDLLPQRRWMREKYAELIRKILSSHSSVLVLITGAPTEVQGAELLKNMVNMDRCVNFAGKTKFADLPVLYEISDFMISNDSGPAHFASVTHMHTFVIFGPETPQLYGSLGPTTPIYAGLACSPCVAATNHRKTVCKDNVCLKVITPEQVYKTVSPMLESKSRAQLQVLSSHST